MTHAHQIAGRSLQRRVVVNATILPNTSPVLDFPNSLHHALYETLARLDSSAYLTQIQAPLPLASADCKLNLRSSQHVHFEALNPNNEAITPAVSDLLQNHLCPPWKTLGPYNY